MESFNYTNHYATPSQGEANLDAIFSALADPTRRKILSRLVDGEATVQEISQPFTMSQPAISKHLKVLEQAGLVERDIDQQRRPARLKAQNMAMAVEWLEHFRNFWGASFDQLDGLLETMQTQKTSKDNGNKR
ncbi:metalloregulator ArsR/SmtB family transcription factor [Lentilitoribacter sp. Alg239-R112]|uniref:ArsR/SmtB family transcription factor n=1 Tax=Lentilitoribacter sp. Alg239-R112 TaxID=2305987 RepID=UPI0013A6CC3E|nr:metalloregulator ArsR/SmtB family transcription factor [Lentilitoribacter sp. Alg239-R112]